MSVVAPICRPWTNIDGSVVVDTPVTTSCPLASPSTVALVRATRSASVMAFLTEAGVPADRVSFERATWTFECPGPPADLVATFRDFYGPTMNAFAAASADGRADELQSELETLFSEQNASEGATEIPATFLRVEVAA